ncbi:hemerythrin domain-containing protein [Actinophytocola sp.]|uniref:hemerythrin domain-containing protein n=1 Tax=Actinophytocola sp. TaxID=1872138 RepID=UPI003D6BDCA2
MTDRLVSFGNQLVEVHLRIREELDRIRDGVADGLTRELRTHCLTFCSTLTRHHEGEDEGAFPVLAREYPRLAPVLEELSRDHVLIADAMTRLAEILESSSDGLGDELATVAALLETHLLYEEKKLVAALNALDPTHTDTAHLSRATTLDAP